ncbi:MAG: 50S ribosomal protein L22 [Candidatus Anstonellaceae archaeon]
MAKYNYIPKSPDEKLAFARREDINASFKDLANVCANIKNRNAFAALKFLEEAAAKKRPIRYFKHNKRRGHLRALGGKKGGYPVKSVKIVLEVLKNAIANASAKGLGECRVVHAVANKQHIYRRLAPKGRRIRHDLETAFVEIVLREIKQPPAKKERKEENKKENKKEIESTMKSEKEQQPTQNLEENKKELEKSAEPKAQEKKVSSSDVNSKAKKFSEVIKEQKYGE